MLSWFLTQTQTQKLCVHRGSCKMCPFFTSCLQRDAVEKATGVYKVIHQPEDQSNNATLNDNLMVMLMDCKDTVNQFGLRAMITL